MFKTITPTIAALLLLSACSDVGIPAQAEGPAKEDPSARPAKIAIASNVAFSQFKIFPGVTEASRNSILAFRVSGQIAELPVHAGQQMKKGQLLAELDDTPYRNVLADRQAKYDLANTQLTRTKALFDKNHVAKAALDTARSQFAAAEVALKMAKDDLGYTRLVAPYDGVVARIDVERFQNVQATAPVMNYQGAKNIDIVFSLPESHFLLMNSEKAKANPTADISFDALPGKSFKAFYKEHDSLPDVTTRSYKNTLTMPRPKDLSILPGMSTNVRLDLGKYTNKGPHEGVLVPVEAVFENAGKRWVWRVDDDNVVHKTEVTVHGIEDNGVRLTAGIKAGDRVIAVGVSHVTQGMKVRTYRKERGL